MQLKFASVALSGYAILANVINASAQDAKQGHTSSGRDFGKRKMMKVSNATMGGVDASSLEASGTKRKERNAKRSKKVSGNSTVTVSVGHYFSMQTHAQIPTPTVAVFGPFHCNQTRRTRYFSKRRPEAF